MEGLLKGVTTREPCRNLTKLVKRLTDSDGMLPHSQPISARPAFPSTSLGGWANLTIKESPSNQADHLPAGDAPTSGPLQGAPSPWDDKQGVESVGGQIDRLS